MSIIDCKSFRPYRACVVFKKAVEKRFPFFPCDLYTQWSYLAKFLTFKLFSPQTVLF